ncbi:2-amino-4-hydroxy-6-hydroxymethyldihydropteridine diphosphokinase [Thiobacter aerophilum]|uniref:2-amino-4-hydroxy-6-hydroxymethyldihydropteridine pyrophosphokinase n=1 Tax=Thiobacter aerophilum TaxID=3121275 RepID=A0ABV0EEZ1_9BURK
MSRTTALCSAARCGGTLAFIALGSNLAEPANQVTRALVELARLPHTRLIARSSLYRTAPVGYLDQPDFINAVASVETMLPPRALLDALLGLEHAFGREREFRNAPRILDLDLLLYGDLVLHEEGLTLPHPRMHERAFVLAPLLEIAPECVIPGRGPAETFLARCLNQSVERIAA